MNLKRPLEVSTNFGIDSLAFMAGIAAIYANYLNDPLQNTSDAILEIF